jgi:hypothetical protein
MDAINCYCKSSDDDQYKLLKIPPQFFNKCEYFNNYEFFDDKEYKLIVNDVDIFEKFINNLNNVDLEKNINCIIMEYLIRCEKSDNKKIIDILKYLLYEDIDDINECNNKLLYIIKDRKEINYTLIDELINIYFELSPKDILKLDGKNSHCYILLNDDMYKKYNAICYFIKNKNLYVQNQNVNYHDFSDKLYEDYFKIYKYKRSLNEWLFRDNNRSTPYYTDTLIDNYRIFIDENIKYNDLSYITISSEIDLQEYIFKDNIKVSNLSLSLDNLKKLLQFKENTIIRNFLNNIKKFEDEYASNKEKDSIIQNNYYIHKDRFELVNTYNYKEIKTLIFNSNKDIRSITINDSLLYEYFLTYIRFMPPMKMKPRICTGDTMNSFGLFSFFKKNINKRSLYDIIKSVKKFDGPSKNKHIYYDPSTNKIIIDHFYKYVNNNILYLENVVLNNINLEIDIDLLKNNLHCIINTTLLNYVKKIGTEHVTISKREYKKNIDFKINVNIKKLNEYNYYE